MGEDSRQENGSERETGGELNNKKKVYIYVPRGAAGCVFKLANQQLIFKEEVKPRPAENAVWK